jgi:CubicO group peptidase (beta-lactamase class C family)
MWPSRDRRVARWQWRAAGRSFMKKGYGLANIEQNVSITPQSGVRHRSTSKQFTAASVLLLEKQGKLSLNDHIRKYLPGEFPDYGHKITILHLLNHTSGAARLSDTF